MYWQVELIDDCLDEIWLDWEELVSCYHLNNPMLDTMFVKQLIKYFPEKIYVAKAFCNKQQLQAIVLLTVEKAGVWKIYKPSQAQTALAVMSNDAELDVKQLMTKLPKFCIKINFLALDKREHSPLIKALPNVLITKSATNITVNVHGDFDHYWDNRIKGLKKNMRRYHNRIEKEVGKLLFVVKSSPLEVQKGVDNYGMIESRGWKGKIGTALHPGNKQGEFYRTLLMDYSKQEQSLVFELILDNQVVASRLCLLNQNMLVILKTTYEESFKRFAVGKVLLYYVIQYIYTHKLSQVIDFYTNANRDQIDWSTEQRDMLNASCYRLDWLNRLAPIIKKFAHRVIKP